jgi:catabolite regulation protein CreA
MMMMMMITIILMVIAMIAAAAAVHHVDSIGTTSTVVESVESDVTVELIQTAKGHEILMGGFKMFVF